MNHVTCMWTAGLVALAMGCGEGDAAGDAGTRSDADMPRDMDGSLPSPERDDASLPPDDYMRPTGPWADETWVVEPFTQAMGGGPAFGPAADVGPGAHTMTADGDGNYYIIVGSSNIGTHRVDIVTPDGLRMPLAGTGRRGMRDGPAPLARFHFGGLAYQPANIQVDDRGNVFVADTGNHRIRRIYRNDEGAYMVDTWAGGGSTRLAVGESAPAREADIGRLLIAATREGRVIGCGGNGCYEVSADGATVRNLGRVPEDDPYRAAPLKMIVFQGDCDDDGDCYFITRSPSYVIHVAADGALRRIAGHLEDPALPKPYHMGDGPPLEAWFDTTPSLVTDPIGDAVYVSGGDEYDVRRVPTDLATTTATLVRNGRWYLMEEHPNRNRGEASFDPAAEGPSRIAGGTLTNLPVAPLVGGDRQGRLYGKLNHWTGPTIEVEGEWLPTRVFRLVRR